MTILYIIGFLFEYIIHIHYLPITVIGKPYNNKKNELFCNQYNQSKQYYKNKSFKQKNVGT